MALRLVPTKLRGSTCQILSGGVSLFGAVASSAVSHLAVGAIGGSVGAIVSFLFLLAAVGFWVYGQYLMFGTLVLETKRRWDHIWEWDGPDQETLARLVADADVPS